MWEANTVPTQRWQNLQTGMHTTDANARSTRLNRVTDGRFDQLQPDLASVRVTCLVGTDRERICSLDIGYDYALKT